MMTYMFNMHRDLYARLVVTYIPNIKIKKFEN